MAKSMRSKREKRLRAIRRDMVEPFYDKKDAAKLAALEAALSAPKLPPPVKSSPFASSSAAMDLTTSTTTPAITATSDNSYMDVEMDDSNHKKTLKPIGKKLKKKLKLSRNKRRGTGKGKFKRRHI